MKRVRVTLGMAGAALISLLSAAAVAFPASVEAQGIVLDRGSFRLFEGGTEVGTEEFVIQRSGSGDALVTMAQGTLTMHDGRSVSTLLRLQGPDMTFDRYRAKVSGGGDERAVAVVKIQDRLEARTSAAWGEELREYRAGPTTFLIDQGVAHHYFVISERMAGGLSSVHSVSPLPETEQTLSVAPGVQETISVGGEAVETTKVQLGSGGSIREVWFDSAGRVVKVSIGDGAFSAERAPRG